MIWCFPQRCNAWLPATAYWSRMATFVGHTGLVRALSILPRLIALNQLLWDGFCVSISCLGVCRVYTYSCYSVFITIVLCFSCLLRKMDGSSIPLTFCSSLIWWRYINSLFRLLWPVIFMMAAIGMPLEHIRCSCGGRCVNVCILTVTHSPAMRVFCFPFSLYMEISIFSVIPASRATSLMNLLTFSNFVRFDSWFPYFISITRTPQFAGVWDNDMIAWIFLLFSGPITCCPTLSVRIFPSLMSNSVNWTAVLSIASDQKNVANPYLYVFISGKSGDLM